MATYYIAPAPLGSDSNDGLAPETPFETLQKGADEAQANLDSQNDIIVLEYCEFGATNIIVSDKSLSIMAFGGISKIIGYGTFLQFDSVQQSKYTVIQNFEISGYTKLIEASKTEAVTNDGDAIVFVSCTAQNMLLDYTNCGAFFGSCDLENGVMQNDSYFALHIQASNFKNFNFLHGGTGNALNESFSSVTESNFDGATGIFLPNKTANETSYFMSTSTFRGAEVTICDVAGYGYTQSYTDGQCVGNNMTRAKVRFTNSPTATWADIDAIPFSPVWTLANMQAKADADLGIGASVMHSDAFLFDAIKRHELNPRIPNAQGGIPHQTNYIRYSTVPKFSHRECKFQIDSKKAILTNGLISSVPSTIGGTTAVQATAADQPQKGYMDMGVFSEASVLDGPVTSLPNTNNGGLGGYGWGALTEASVPPTKAGGEVVFTNGKRLRRTAVAKTYEAYSVEYYMYLDTVASVTAQQLAFAFLLNSDNYLAYTLSPVSNKYYLEFRVSDGASSAYCTKGYNTLADFNANIAGRWLHVVGVYNKGRSYLYVDGMLVQSQPYNQTISVVAGATTTIQNKMAVSTLRVRYAKVFNTGLSASQVALAYANRNTYTYELPRQGILSESGDFLSINTLQSLTLQSLSAFTWVNVNSGISLATNTLYPFISNLSGNYGFEFGIRTATTTASFYLKIGNGAAVDTFYFDALTFASFAAKYFGKWIYLGFSFGPIKRFYVGGVNFTYTTSHISIVTTANNVLLLKGETGTAPTGTLIELAMLLERCINQGEVNEKMRVDKDSHSWLR